MQNRVKGNAQGIDVSHHQGVIDWPAVAAAGISFVFIKATQNSMDPKFLANVKGAKAAGLLVGAYHYLDDKVTSTDMAREAAQVFFKAVVAAGGVDVFDLPFVLDYESNKSKLSALTISAIAKAFMEEIQRYTGRIPMLYTYPDFIGNFSGLTKYPLWIARYSTQVPVDASGWKHWEFWQYSDGSAGGVLPIGGRKVPGISGPVDLNEFAGTVKELQARYGKQQVKGDEEDMGKIAELEKRIEELEKRINMSGNQTPPEWAHKALEAAKAVKAIKTSNDKSQAELVCIQILYNLGLFNSGIKKLIDLNREGECK
ncbi:glycoside hydrolase family 25 protein [Paenibacillus cellulositrophicus]|uniref:glycoside hydrolase family 25 protein n=1 Tax=Paenibacillus cellulositrophicus TaxID=562959 RepID=UPI003D963765